MIRLKNFLKIVLGVVVIGVLIVVGLTILEYRPKDVENLETVGEAIKENLDFETNYTVSTFNIGYGALSDEEDFFMDGGSKVRPDEKELVVNNLNGIKEEIIGMNNEFVLIQEIDLESKRSYQMNQVDALLLDEMEGAFAYNFKAVYPT